MLINDNSKTGFGGTIVFIILLAAAILRCTFLENVELSDNLSIIEPASSAKSLIITSAIFIISAAVIISKLFSNKTPYLKSSIEPFFIIFVIINFCVLFRAADKYTSLINSLTLCAPVAMALAIVNLCKDLNKTVLIFIVVAAAGAVNTAQCFDQAYLSKDLMLEEYKANPDNQLAGLGIEKDTLQHFLYEHRLYSKGTSGFFRTANVAGSFFILSTFCAAYLLYCGFNKKNSWLSAILVLSMAVNLAGLILTRSKGAILSAFLCLCVSICYFRFSSVLIKYRKIILKGFILIFISAVVSLTVYGIKFGTLPGGKSMLVRWQYWTASAQMITDFPFGIGAGNFTYHYPAYKEAAAIETITEPHNFIISGLCQFGIVGFVLMLICLGMIFVKTFKVVKIIDSTKKILPSATALTTVIFAVAILRPAFIQAELTNVTDVMLYLTLVYYIAPAAVFLLAVSPFLIKNLSAELIRHSTSIIVIGIFGVFLHNIIDLAFFEPPIWTIIWLLIAAVLASKNNVNETFLTKYNPTITTKFLCTIFFAVMITAYSYFGIFISIKTASNLNKAIDNYKMFFNSPTMIWQKDDRYFQTQQLDKMIYYLDNTIKANPLSSNILSIKGKMLTQAFFAEKSNINILFEAKNAFSAALSKNPYNYKDYENLADISKELAIKNPDESDKHLQASLDYLRQAVKLFPASERINFQIAAVAEKQGLSDIANEHYQKTIELEEAYIAQFKLMFPNSPIVSRIGLNNYELAKSKISAMKIQ